MYKLFRQRINQADIIQLDLDGCKRDIGLINAMIQKLEEAEQIKKQAQEKPSEPKTEKQEKKPVEKKVVKKKKEK